MDDKKRDKTEELRRVIRAHATKYPLMRPRDAVKLVFQSAFGGGHLISDRDECLCRIREEWENAVTVAGVPLTEDIGGGAVRFDFRSPRKEEEGYDPERVFLAFVASSEADWGTDEDLGDGLAVLLDLAGEGIFGFSRTELGDYIAEYRAAGCPPVSHSEIYREAYRPSYRVMKAEFLKN